MVKSVSSSIDYLLQLAFPMSCRGNFIEPVAFAHALIVTLSLLNFLPSADFSKEAARVLSGNKRKLRPFSSQLKI